MSKAMEQRAFPPLRTANLTIWAEGAELRAHFKNNQTLENSRPSMKLNIRLGMLGDKLLKIRTKLSEIAESGIWNEMKNPLVPSARSREILGSFTKAVVTEGSALYQQLLQEPELGQYIRKINELPHGSSISIETDCALFPWEILYPSPFSISLPRKINSGLAVEPEKLWGNRFLIEHYISPRNGSSGVPPIREHRNGPSYVSINVNPAIEDDFDGVLYKPVTAHKRFFDSRLRRPKQGELRMTGDSIKEMLLSKSKANIIYLYCHGKSDDPYAKGGGEQLELDRGEVIEPSFFDYGDNKYQRGPIVILNSCSSGAYSPLSFSNFHSEFIRRRALGIIGTTISMPATFASAFGQRIMRDYLKGDKPIGKVLQKLREELMLQGNPLGLFYVLQCPWHVKAPLP